MRLSLPTLLLCAVMLATTAWAQTAGVPSHPEDPSAEYLGTMTLNVTPQSEVQGERSVLEASGSLACLIGVFRSEGRTDYCIKAESIQIIGDGSWVDVVGTKLLFDLISRTAILQGITEGYAACPTSCVSSPASRVYTEACVTRSGKGAATRLKVCEQNPGNSMREYSVCCPLGLPVPVIDMLRSTGIPCDQGGDCETTSP